MSRILQEFQIVKKLSPLRTIFSETHKNTDDSGRRFGILLTVTLQESKGAGKAGGERERKKEAKAGEEGEKDQKSRDRGTGREATERGNRAGRQKLRRTEAVGEKQETGEKCGRQEAGRAGEEDTGKAQRRDTGKTGAGSGEKGWRK